MPKRKENKMLKKYIKQSYIQLSKESDEVVVDMLFVDAPQRGLKLGYQLLELALEHAISLNLNLSLFAESDEPDNISNEKLVEYYRDFGFESDPDSDQLMTYFI